jgi:hypothetical protein
MYPPLVVNLVLVAGQVVIGEGSLVVSCAFAARHADRLFMSIHDLDTLPHDSKAVCAGHSSIERI